MVAQSPVNDRTREGTPSGHYQEPGVASVKQERVNAASLEIANEDVRKSIEEEKNALLRRLQELEQQLTATRIGEQEKIKKNSHSPAELADYGYSPAELADYSYSPAELAGYKKKSAEKQTSALDSMLGFSSNLEDLSGYSPSACHEPQVEVDSSEIGAGQSKLQVFKNSKGERALSSSLKDTAGKGPYASFSETEGRYNLKTEHGEENNVPGDSIIEVPVKDVSRPFKVKVSLLAALQCDDEKVVSQAKVLAKQQLEKHKRLCILFDQLKDGKEVSFSK